jgi:centromere/kinetochore protein ZW10
LLGNFLTAHMFNGKSSGSIKARELFAAAFYSHLTSELYDKCIYPNLPSDSSDLNQFSTKCQAVLVPFEEEWKLQGKFAYFLILGLIPSTMTEISLMIHKIPFLFARKRRATLLSAARDIIISEDWNTVEVHDSTEQGGISLLLGSNKAGGGKERKGGGKDGLDTGVADLKLPRFLISVQAETIIETVYQTIREATGADPDVATELFFLVKDLLDLYRSLFPVVHAGVLSTFPGRAAVFYNDTQYFSHHLFTLAEVLKREVGEDEKFLVFGTGLDVVPEFRRVGQQWFRFMMRSQRDLLLGSVGKMEGLSGISDDKRLEVAEGGIRDAVYQYLSLSRVLKVYFVRFYDLVYPPFSNVL